MVNTDMFSRLCTCTPEKSAVWLPEKPKASWSDNLQAIKDHLGKKKRGGEMTKKYHSMKSLPKQCWKYNPLACLKWGWTKHCNGQPLIDKHIKQTTQPVSLLSSSVIVHLFPMVLLSLQLHSAVPLQSELWLSKTSFLHRILWKWEVNCRFST